MEKALEKNGERLNALFHLITGQLKNSISAWEDFTNKAAKLQTCLRSTVTASSAFLESFQNMADMASSTQGATRDIGISLTRLCLRHRSIHSKMKNLTNSMVSMLVTPVAERLDEWKKIIGQLEKDHNRDMKKAQGEVKKSMSTFSRLQKKAKKDNREETMKQLCESRVDFQRRLENLEKVAGNGVKNAMMEERKRYSTFVHIIRPFVEEEISMLGDITHLQEIMDELIKQTSTTIMFSEEELLDGTVFPLHRNFSSPSPPRVHPKLHSSFSLTSDPPLATKAQTRHHQNYSSEAELSQANTKSEEQAGNDNMVQSKHCSRSQHHRSTLSHLTMRLRPHSVAMMHNGMKACNASLIMQRSETCDGSSYRFEGNALKEENMTRSLCMEDTAEDIFSTRFDDMISTLNTLDKDAKEPVGSKTEENDARPKERTKLQFCYPNSDDITPTNENQEQDFAEQFLSQLQKESYIPNNEVVDNIAVQDTEGVKQIATPTCSAQTHVSKESTI